MGESGWRQHWRVGILALACWFGLAGCGKTAGPGGRGQVTARGGDGSSSTWTDHANNPKVTPANAEKVAVGMRESEVRDVLGRPMYLTDQRSGGKSTRVSVWQNGGANIIVTFE